MASLTVDWQPADGFTLITCQSTDDLPPHIKGTAYWVSHTTHPSGYYYEEPGQEPVPVEFIDNAWYILHFSCTERVFGTCASYQVDPNNQNVGLGCWSENDFANQNNQSTQVVSIQTTNLTKHWAQAPAASDSESEQNQTTWGPDTCYDLIRLHFTMQIHWTATIFLSLFLTLKPLYDMILWSFVVWYNLASSLGTIRAVGSSMYDINLRATHTMILSIRGVTIPIDLVSSAMDSIKRHIVLFKLVTIPTSDPKSEFLCQSSSSHSEHTDSPEHLICLGYLPHPCHHVSPVLPQPQCSNRVPEAEAPASTSQASWSQPLSSSWAGRSTQM